MYVSTKHKMLYYGSCKTASSSVIMALEAYYDATGRNAPRERKAVEAWPVGAHHSIFLPKEYEDYFKFTTVRNPYTREIAKYNFLPTRENIPATASFIRNMNFKEYIDWVCSGEVVGNWRFDYWRYTQKEIIFNQPIENGCVPVVVDRFLHMENLKEEFLNLPFVNESNVFIESKNNFAKEIRIREFPKNLVDKFYDFAKDDFELFGYDKEPPLYEVVEEDYRTVNPSQLNASIHTIGPLTTTLAPRIVSTSRKVISRVKKVPAAYKML